MHRAVTCLLSLDSPKNCKIPGKHPRIFGQPTRLQFLSKSIKSDSQGISSEILYHGIQHHSLNQNHYLDYKKSPQKKLASRNSSYEELIHDSNLFS